MFIIMNFFGLVGHVLGLKSRSDVPDVCYSQCNNAFIEAQKIGKTPDLCLTTSSFQKFLASCLKCISANANDTVKSVQDYVAPTLGQFIDFCSVQPAQNIEQQSLVSSLASQASHFSSVLSEASSLGILKPSTTTQLVFVTQTPNNTVTPAQTSSPQQTSLPILPARTVSKAWIAGAVIGPLLLLVAILVATYFIWRRKRRPTSGAQEGEAAEKKEEEWVGGKAQLHGESMAQHELDGDQTGKERTVSELPALEVVGSELDT